MGADLLGKTLAHAKLLIEAIKALNDTEHCMHAKATPQALLGFARQLERDLQQSFVLGQRTEALEAIKARIDLDNGSRTFDQCLNVLGWIDDECRRALRTA